MTFFSKTLNEIEKQKITSHFWHHVLRGWQIWECENGMQMIEMAACIFKWGEAWGESSYRRLIQTGSQGLDEQSLEHGIVVLSIIKWMHSRRENFYYKNRTRNQTYQRRQFTIKYGGINKNAIFQEDVHRISNTDYVPHQSDISFQRNI